MPYSSGKKMQKKMLYFTEVTQAWKKNRANQLPNSNNK